MLKLRSPELGDSWLVGPARVGEIGESLFPEIIEAAIIRGAHCS